MPMTSLLMMNYMLKGIPIFEKHFRRGQKIELFSWPGIDFLPDFGNFPVSDPGQTHLNFADTPKISIFGRKNDE